ncbi:PREDICTED: dyslexia susceptibility 1 candidate gene 1 protein homolog [Rhagoletis zephyria]|uniref:dyslexia susceptibility 1 candidate gene 1 protein homolog n=1 Tax=Rhagoletis zephyria TaxID=28612 RepID=UPI0008112E35|nr:PREDICTED: dyslexia susceptibility 1 candidate gene 1 protein homolog [Rhagoletis zephyria]
MVQVTQTEEDIKIIIELNRLITRKPDVVLLPQYIKFNNPPIFFERHLVHEIDELSSFCRIFKNEARIVLVKKQKAIWPEVFQKLSKDELKQKRLEIAELIVERNKERDKVAVERFEQKRRCEIDKEVKRETAMRERVKQFQENARREALMVGVRKEAHAKPPATPQISTPPATATINNTNVTGQRIGTPVVRPWAGMRSGGKINVSFSKFTWSTPKRESLEGVQRQFGVQNENENNNDNNNGMPMESQAPSDLNDLNATD